MEKNGKNKIKLTDKVTKENLNSPQFHKWVARILAVCFILMLAVQFIGCMSFNTYASENETITLKAGTYRLNDVLDFNLLDNPTTILLDFEFLYDGYRCNTLTINHFDNISFEGNTANGNSLYFANDQYEFFIYATGMFVGVIEGVDNEGYNVSTPVSVTFENSVVVGIDFGTWFITNTNYNEVNATTSTVNIYGGDNYDEIQWTIEYEEGMTWGEWYNSEYNYDVNTNSRIFNYGTLYTNTTEYSDVYYTSGYIIEGVQYYRVLMTEYSNENGNTPNADDLIQDFTDGNFYLLHEIVSVSKDYHDGYEEGRDVGYTNGYNYGYNTGYDEGETNGYNEGRTDGYNSGYNDGASAYFGENIIGGTFNGVLGALNSIIIYQTPNGTPVTIMGIVWGVIGIAVFIWVLKLFVGG